MTDTGQTTANSTENLKREFSEIFFAQHRIIWGTTAIIFVLALLISFFWPPTYSATGSILVRRKDVDTSPQRLEEARDQLRQLPISKEDLTSEVAILTSNDILSQTYRHVKADPLMPQPQKTTMESFVAQLKKLVKSLLSRTAVTPTSAETEINQAIRRLKAKLVIDIVPASNVINVSYYGQDPTETLTVLRTLLEVYMAQRSSILNPVKAAFFSEQADRYRNEMATMDDKIVSLVEKNRVTDPKREIENNLDLKTKLGQNLSDLENVAIEKRLSIRQIDEALKTRDLQFFTFIDLDSLKNLSAKLQELYVERGAMLRKFTKESSKIKLIDRQVNDTSVALKAEVVAHKAILQTQLDIVTEKINNIQTQLRDLDAKNTVLKRQLLETTRLEREAALLNSSYETFNKRLEETRIAGDAGAVASAVSLLSRAFPSNGPVFPKKKILIPFGLVVGFITGCSLGFMREFFDHSVKRASDVEKHIGLPVILSIRQW